MELPFEPDSAVLRRVLAHGVFAEKAVALFQRVPRLRRSSQHC